MTIFMLILTFQYYILRGTPCGPGKELFWGSNHTAFLTLYSLTFFFANFGPNVTTFTIHAELFLARLRSIYHGISTAAGKAGAIVGTFGFLYAAQSSKDGHQDKGYPTRIGLKNLFLLLTVINAAGFLCTFLVPETNGRSLEDLLGENAVEMQPSTTRPNNWAVTAQGVQECKTRLLKGTKKNVNNDHPGPWPKGPAQSVQNILFSCPSMACKWSTNVPREQHFEE